MALLDAEDPKVIPMDLPSPHQVPSGPMMRARARALETEVTSLLSHFHFDTHETWLLPQTETLCILRYQGVIHGDAKEQENPKRKMDVKTEKKKGKVSRSLDDLDRRPDDPANPPEDT